jgi:hypothetical protein
LEWIGVLLPCTEPGKSDKPSDVFNIADTGSAAENSMVGGVRAGLTGCSERIADLETQSVVPQANSLVAKAGCARAGQYV